MKTCNENGLRTVDDYWRDLERNVYHNTDPFDRIELRKIFFAGAFTTMTILVETIENTKDDEQSSERLDALKDELIAFANTMKGSAQAPPPESEGP